MSNNPRFDRRSLRTALLHLGLRWRWVGLTVGVLIALVVLAAFFIDEPLRRGVESQMNRNLKGYTAHIGRLSFHPLGFSLTLYDLTMSQDAHPDPPVLHVPRLDAGVDWRALIHARVVAEFDLTKPDLYVDRTHLELEAKDPTPVSEHGWQQAFEAIYPLRINRVAIGDGQVVYVERGQAQPLRIQHLNVVASNVRNVHSRERDYPSELHADGVVFDTGKIAIDGNADFLAEPHLGIKADIKLAGVHLDYFKPVAQRYGVSIQRGTLSADGHIEYAPTVKVVELRDAAVQGLRLEYVHVAKRAGGVKQATQKTEQATREAAQNPELLLRAKSLRLVDSEVAVVNKTATPEYRVFMTHVNLSVENFSNRRSEGVGVVRLKGKFMGSGDTTVTARFHPQESGQNVDVKLALEDTDMTKLNDLLRAYGRFDVTSGVFSMYSELTVKAGRVDGYLKPLFRDVRVAKGEQHESFGQKVRKKVIGAAFKVLKNVPRKEVATKAEISGRLDQPQTSKLDVALRLVENAFFKAILPGFDREAAQSAKG